MSLMTIRLELGRTSGAPQGDSQHGYEFVAPLNRDGHLDIAEWASKKDRCGVRSGSFDDVRNGEGQIQVQP